MSGTGSTEGVRQEVPLPAKMHQSLASSSRKALQDNHSTAAAAGQERGEEDLER